MVILFNGFKVSDWENEKTPDMDGGDSCTMMSMYLMSQTCTLKEG